MWLDYDWCLFSSLKTRVRGWRTGGSKPLPSRKPCIPGGTFRWWPMYFMVSLLIKLVRTRWLDILTNFVSRFHEMRRRKRWPIRDLLDMAKGKLLQSASLPMVQWNHYSNWETVVKWQRLSQYFRIPRNTLCLSPRFCISFDPCKEIQESLGFWFPRRGFLISGTGFRILCPWNLDSGYQSSVDSRSLSCIPDSKAHDSWFYKQKFRGQRISQPKSLGFRNPYSLTWVE